MLKRLAIHTSNYSIGNFLVIVASVISFPIFTRIFTVDEYGLMNLISATLVFLVGIAKLGVQHSVVRLYGEVDARKDPEESRRYYSTVTFGMMATGLIVTIGWATISQVIPSDWWNDPRARGLLLLTSVLVLIRVMDSCFTNLLRAQERSGIYSTYNVIKRYIGLATILLVVFYISRDIYGFYAATIATELIAVAVLGTIIWRKHRFTVSLYSAPMFYTMLAYGIPMIGYELGGVLLGMGDRYVIQSMLGSTDLGIYSAGYNLCEYLQQFVITSMVQAVVPMYMRVWAEKGESETVQFIRNALHYYLMLGIPVVVGLSAIGTELLVVLASEKYRESAVVIPYVMSGMMMDGMVIMIGAGLFIGKQTMLLAALVAGSAVVNVVLNLIFVPRFGIVGAAAVTLLAYGLLSTATFFVGQRHLAIKIPWGSLVKFSLLAAIMFACISQISIDNKLLELACKIIAGASIYGSLVLASDIPVRTWLLTTLRRKLP